MGGAAIWMNWPKGAPGKGGAGWLRGRTTVPLQWASDRRRMGHYTRASQAVSRMNGKSGRKLEPLRRQLLSWTQNWMKRAKCHDSRTDPFRPFHDPFTFT